MAKTAHRVTQPHGGRVKFSEATTASLTAILRASASSVTPQVETLAANRLNLQPRPRLTREPIRDLEDDCCDSNGHSENRQNVVAHKAAAEELGHAHPRRFDDA